MVESTNSGTFLKHCFGKFVGKDNLGNKYYKDKQDNMGNILKQC